MSENTIWCPDCERMVVNRNIRRGLCPSCYLRRRRRGNMDEPAPPKYKRWLLGEKYVDHVGYVKVCMPGGRRRHEHRILMEEMIGRPLSSDESVHHKNGNRSDNRPENLELWFKGQPAGQRVDDLIAYVVNHHLQAVVSAIDGVIGLDDSLTLQEFG